MSNNVNFDQIRYFQLLKKDQTLRNQGTALFKQNPKEDRQLRSYQIILESQIYYNRRAQYTALVEEYLRQNAGEAGARLFLWEFNYWQTKDNKTLESLENEILEKGISRLDNFFIHPKAQGFSKLIDEIFSDCEFLTFNPEETYGFNHHQFRDSIQKIFFQMKNYS